MSVVCSLAKGIFLWGQDMEPAGGRSAGCFATNYAKWKRSENLPLLSGFPHQRLTKLCAFFFFFASTGTFKAAEKAKARAASGTAEEEEGKRPQRDESSNALAETTSRECAF